MSVLMWGSKSDNKFMHSHMTNWSIHTWNNYVVLAVKDVVNLAEIYKWWHSGIVLCVFVHLRLRPDEFYYVLLCRIIDLEEEGFSFLMIVSSIVCVLFISFISIISFWFVCGFRSLQRLRWCNPNSKNDGHQIWHEWQGENYKL